MSKKGEKELLRERILHLLLDHTLQGARAVGRVVALVGEPGTCRIVQLQEGPDPLKAVAAFTGELRRAIDGRADA